MKVLRPVAAALLVLSYSAFAQSDSGFDLNAIAKDAERRFSACPRREVVFKSKRIWQKEAWGPPSDVIADAKPNDSSLYPYVLTVEFNLSISYGPERKSKTEAEGDTELSPSSVLLYLGAATSRNRNIYLVNKDGIRLKTREILTHGAPGQWTERATWPNACWDWVGAQ
jgi:hypothetical protein